MKKYFEQNLYFSIEKRACFKNTALASFFIAAMTVNVAAQANAGRNLHPLGDLSLEELAALPVISVSKSATPVSESVASVFLITNDDIHKAASASLPEALRLAPNLQVARVDARNYAITARGFNNPFENKLLVMIDGRTIYSPLFSGVYWDAQDVVLEDIDRIEVVSGAGGTLWGANAVNGVVNIVSRSAAQTKGALISASGSANEHYASARYGGSVGEAGDYRVYVKHAQHDDTQTANDVSTVTGFERVQSGFRFDWEDNKDSFTLQGDAYSGRLGQRGTPDIKISGVNILARHNWQTSARSNFSLQTYFDHTERDQPNAFAQKMNTWDIELQHQFVINNLHNIIWGAGYRYITDRIDNDENFAFLPGDVNRSWRNIFIQDEISLADNWKLTLGSKWEDNPYTGFESMPGIKLGWEPDATKLVWTSVSRAVRSPSRIDRDLYAPTNPPVIDGVPQYSVAGGPGFVSEIANVFEAGYRSQPVARVSWSITGYYSEYDKLRTLELNPAAPGLIFKNMAEAENYGVEVWGSWQTFPDLRIHAGLNVQEINVTLKPGSMDFSNTTGLANGDPDYSWMLRSEYTLSDSMDIFSHLRYVDEIKGFDLPSYTALDIHFSWTITPQLELSLVGQNLLGDHAEFGMAPGRSEFGRSVFAKLVWGL